MIKNVLLSCALVVGLVFSFTAQSYKVQTFDEVNSKTVGANVLGIDDDGFVYATSSKGLMSWVKVIDAKTGKIVAEKAVDYNLYPKKGFSAEKVKFLDNRLCLLVKNKKENEFFLVQLNKNLELVGEPFEVGGFYGRDGVLFWDHFSFFYSKSNNNVEYYLTEGKSKEGKLIFSILGYDEGEKQKAIDLEIPGVDNYYRLSFVAHDDNLFYILLTLHETVENRRVSITGKNEFYYKLFKIDEDGEVEELLLELGDDDLSISDILLSRQNEDILLSGNVYDKQKDAFVGIFSTKFDPEFEDLEDFDEVFFEDDFISNYWDTRLKGKEIEDYVFSNEVSNPSNYIMYKALPTEDGGMVYFSQKYEVELDIVYSTDANGQRTKKTTYYYYYTSLVVSKVDKEGELVFVNFVPIYQRTVKKNPGKGFEAIIKDNSLYVLHVSSENRKDLMNGKNDMSMDKKMNKIAITKISETGELSSENIIDTKDEKMYFSLASVIADEKRGQFIMLPSKIKLGNPSKKIKMRVIKL